MLDLLILALLCHLWLLGQCCWLTVGTGTEPAKMQSLDLSPGSLHVDETLRRPYVQRHHRASLVL